MAVGPILDGRLVRLRPVHVDDAAATIAIRNTPGFEVGLPRLPDDLDRQREWIAQQRATRNDYYFCVEALTNKAISGLIGLSASSGTPGPWRESGAWEWGRWASVASDPRCAIEGASLLMYFATDLGVPGIWGRVLRANSRVLAFHERLGYTRSWTTETERYFLAEGSHVELLHRNLGGATPHTVSGRADREPG